MKKQEDSRRWTKNKMVKHPWIWCVSDGNHQYWLVKLSSIKEATNYMIVE